MTLFVGLLVLFLGVCNGAIPDQDWGYVDVRPGAHMFWWLYGSTNPNQSRDKLPLVIWLQGGPGASGTGYGNFEELGPLDVNLQPRNTTWVQVANVMFIDQPVGSGYSYVDTPSAYTTNNDEISADLVTMTIEFYKKYPQFENQDLWVFCESYGGKMTTGFAEALLTAKAQGKIRVNFRGIGLGDSWISPIDYVNTWGPLLQQVSLMDQRQADELKQTTDQCTNLVENGKWEAATTCWSTAEVLVELFTDSVDFYNFLQHNVNSLLLTNKYYTEDEFHTHYLKKYAADPLTALMNGPMKQQLGIPANVTWGGQSNAVFSHLRGDFMKPVIDGVDRLLQGGLLNVSVYNGQLDLICDTPGTELWMTRLKWPGMADFYASPKVAQYAHGAGATDGFRKGYKQLSYYTINNAGHMVPADNGPMSLKMIRSLMGVN